MGRWIIFLLTLTFHPLALADWRVAQSVGTDKKPHPLAIVKNESGHLFSIYRVSENGPVWGKLSLPENIREKIDGERLPVYQIDDDEPRDLMQAKQFQESSKLLGTGMVMYELGHTQISFNMWHGNINEGISRDLISIMEGRKIVFRYSLSNGDDRETSFSLKGSASAISAAIGIDAVIDHAAQRRSAEYRKAYTAETNLCDFGSKIFDACFSRVRQCGRQASNNVDLFKSCMKRKDQ